MHINKRLEILIIIAILLILFFLGFVKFKNLKSLENVLIFNLYDNSKNNEYVFDISSEQEYKKSCNLFSTLNMESLVNEKIAPGTNGEFEIILNSSKDTHYQITFDSKNVKPHNLLFKIKNDFKKYKSLDELEEKLKGILNKDRGKNICIEWFWDYETDQYSNFQDTLDGQNIQEYNFDINIFSY